jgi:AICAR transformylase/IMP cyclohydrolase PurH
MAAGVPQLAERFADALMVIAGAGATAVIQPGGSMRDDRFAVP